MINTGEYFLVYHYQYWDEDKRQMVTSKWMATLECIRNGLGVPIIESGLRVPRESVDDLGRLIVNCDQQGAQSTGQKKHR
jgi:hypothetical protein